MNDPKLEKLASELGEIAAELARQIGLLRLHATETEDEQ